MLFIIDFQDQRRIVQKISIGSSPDTILWSLEHCYSLSKNQKSLALQVCSLKNTLQNPNPVPVSAALHQYLKVLTSLANLCLKNNCYKKNKNNCYSSDYMSTTILSLMSLTYTVSPPLYYLNI